MHATITLEHLTYLFSSNTELIVLSSH